MTIKLLTPRDLDVGGRYVTHPAGSLVTLGSATEAGLIASKEATADLTGGIVYAPPVPSGQPVNVEAISSGSGPVFQDGDEAHAIVVAELDGGGNPTGNFTQTAAPSRSAALA